MLLSCLLDSLFHLSNMEPQELHASDFLHLPTLPTTPVTMTMSTRMTAAITNTDTLRETPTTQECAKRIGNYLLHGCFGKTLRVSDCIGAFMLPSYYFSVCTSRGRHFVLGGMGAQTFTMPAMPQTKHRQIFRAANPSRQSNHGKHGAKVLCYIECYCIL